MMARLYRALLRFEDHWVADLIGVVALGGLLWSGLVLGYAMGLK